MLEDKAGQGGYNKDVNMKNMVALLQQPFDCSRLKVSSALLASLLAAGQKYSSHRCSFLRLCVLPGFFFHL